MATSLLDVAISCIFFIAVSLHFVVLAVMYEDKRIRTSNCPTPIPFNYKAYIFRCFAVDSLEYKVILAPSLLVAHTRLKDFTRENDLDVFWSFVHQDDFEVVFPDNVIPK